MAQEEEEKQMARVENQMNKVSIIFNSFSSPCPIPFLPFSLTPSLPLTKAASGSMFPPS